MKLTYRVLKRHVAQQLPGAVLLRTARRGYYLRLAPDTPMLYFYRLGGVADYLNANRVKE